MSKGIAELHRICTELDVAFGAPREKSGISLFSGAGGEDIDVEALREIDIYERKAFSESQSEPFLVVPRDPTGLFVGGNLEDLVSNGLDDCRIPRAGYLVEEKFGWDLDARWGQEPARFATLQRCGELIGHFSKLADTRDSSGSLIFVRLRKLVIRPSLTFADFESVGRTNKAIERLCGLLGKDDFLDTKQDIFRSSLIEEFASNGRGPTISFGTVLMRIAALENRYDTDLQIYISEHGFEKLRDAAITRKIELGGKIESLVTRVEAFTLTVPPAIYLVAENIDTSEGLGKTLDFSTNMLLLISSSIFFVLMIVAHIRHFFLNRDIRADIETVRNDFEERAGESYKTKIRDVFRPLLARLTWANALSWVRSGLASIPMIVVLCKVD